MTSDWRGENRMTSAPKRAISKRAAPVAMSSMAQQASPIGIGQSEFLRIQLMAVSSRVKMTFPSIFESYATGVVSNMGKDYGTVERAQENFGENEFNILDLRFK